MAIEEQYDLTELRNDTERLVFAELERRLAGAGPEVPRTQECVLDMAAYALNHVPPMYRVNLMGRLYAHSAADTRAEQVGKAVDDAIRVVTENPPR